MRKRRWQAGRSDIGANKTTISFPLPIVTWLYLICTVIFSVTTIAYLYDCIGCIRCNQLDPHSFALLSFYRRITYVSHFSFVSARCYFIFSKYSHQLCSLFYIFCYLNYLRNSVLTYVILGIIETFV